MPTELVKWTPSEIVFMQEKDKILQITFIKKSSHPGDAKLHLGSPILSDVTSGLFDKEKLQELIDFLQNIIAEWGIIASQNNTI